MSRSWFLIRPGLLPRPQTDVVQHPFIFAPFRLDPHVETEIHASPEELLELLARRRADAFDHVTALADHDRLVRFAIDHDRAIQPQKPFPALRSLRLFEALHNHGARERN